MKRLVLIAVAALAALVAASPAAAGHGDGGAFRARLTGFEETPAISTRGHGTFRAELAADGMSLRYELSYADLEGGSVGAAHIHFGQRGVAGGVSAFLCGGGGKPSCPASGQVAGTIVPADVVGPTAQGIAAGEFAELLRAMRTGVTYANVHTATYANGEIRGQIRGRGKSARD